MYAYLVVNLLSLVFLAFAIARATRLVVDDSIASGFRRWVVKTTGEGSGWTTLVHCIWCTGWWMSWLLTAVIYPFLDLPWWMLPLTAVAMAQVAPMILQLSDRMMAGVD